MIERIDNMWVLYILGRWWIGFERGKGFRKGVVLR